VTCLEVSAWIFPPLGYNPVMDYLGRQRRLRQLLEDNKLDAILVTHLPNVRYLCGFTGSAAALILGKRTLFFTDGRYTEQAREQVKGARIGITRGAALTGATEALTALKSSRVGVEADHVTMGTHINFRKTLPKAIRLRPTHGLVEQLRLVKDADELRLIREAVIAGAAPLKSALKAIRPGATELEVAAEIEYAARRQGAEGMSFETIVAAGPRSALPHGTASNQRIHAKGFVVLDFGVILRGYCSDMTRTVFVGDATKADRLLYGAVLEAQMAAITAVGPGVEVGQVDAAARSVLRKAKLDRYFTHSTGHGVGLEIHEAPRVARAQRQQLQPGMVITIEPGAYVPGRGGVRIEDMVAVTERGCEVLTPARKELLEL